MPRETILRAPRLASAALIGLSIALVVYAYAPLLGAWYVADDWHFFALYRHLDSPLSFVYENPVTSYFYRPIPLLVGWGAFKCFELNSVGHYALNIALHLWVGVEIYRLVTIDDNSRTNIASHSKATVLAMTALFVLFPLTAGTVSWISNRFDLIATAASFAAIRCAFLYAQAPRIKRLASMSAWAAIACLSKESGFAAIAACAFAVFAVQRFNWRARAVLHPALGLAVVVVGVFALRLLAMGSLLPPAGDLPQPVGYAEGVVRWSVAFARTLYSNAAATVGGVLVLFALIISVARARLPGLANAWLSISVLIYASVVIVAQAPIAKAAFPEGISPSVSHRFFYSIIASLVFVSIRVVYAGNSQRNISNRAKVLFFATLASLALAFAHSTHGMTVAWSRDTQFRRDASLGLVRELQALASARAASNAQCVMRLSAETDSQLNFDGTFDFMLKAHLSSAGPAVNCLVIGKRPIATSLTRLAPCEKASFAPFRSIDDRFPAVAVGGICKYFFLRE